MISHIVAFAFVHLIICKKKKSFNKVNILLIVNLDCAKYSCFTGMDLCKEFLNKINTLTLYTEVYNYNFENVYLNLTRFSFKLVLNPIQFINNLKYTQFKVK